ncbi:MAG: L-threonylcarbamoyladenylate synthase [Nevskiales bacterium]
MTPHHLRHALRALRAGGVIAYPTEAVWGLGCDPLNGAAITRLLQIKHRSIDKGVILIAHELAALSPFLRPLNPSLKRRVQATWPGAVTWLLPAAPSLPYWISGGRDSVAVRVTAHPLARALCASFGRPLVSTSANPADRRPARNARQVRAYFGDRLEALLPGATGGLTRPTAIRDARTERVVRR